MESASVKVIRVHAKSDFEPRHIWKNVADATIKSKID
jgi:hypothetical protein